MLNLYVNQPPEPEPTYDLTGLSRTEAYALMQLAGSIRSRNNPVEHVFQLLSSKLPSDHPLGNLRLITNFLTDESETFIALKFKNQDIPQD
jgi:hypothetical protein